ncbi:MAG TPA: sugar phosphate isomerase/epimerase [Chloroflexota bacterium]|nr:sugar phosphate isomerase/epimerase [Chloroflexota bacterium]
MKFGFSTLGCPGWTLEQTVDKAQEYGYDGIELRLLDGEVITPASLRTNFNRIANLFGSGKPELIVLGSSVRLTAADPAERAKNEQDLLAFIEIAQELKVPLVRVFGGLLPEGTPLSVGVERVSESLLRCAPIAERAGVTIALETHDAFSASSAVAAVLAKVKSSAVGALWDSHHPYRMGEAVAQVWTNLANRLVHFHVKDAQHRPDGTWQLVLLGEGEVPCREIVRALVMRGYHGYVVVEWEKKWHPEIEEPEVALPQHIKLMREWIADLV